MTFEEGLKQKDLLLNWDYTSTVTTPQGDNTKERPLICQCKWEKGDSEYIDYNIQSLKTIDGHWARF